MKFIVLFVMEQGRDILLDVAEVTVGRFSENPARKLFIVMIVTPLVMNSAQLWFIDNVIKRTERIDTDSLARKLLAT
jgi:hypothetical protein